MGHAVTLLLAAQIALPRVVAESSTNDERWRIESVGHSGSLVAVFPGRLDVWRLSIGPLQATITSGFPQDLRRWIIDVDTRQYYFEQTFLTSPGSWHLRDANQDLAHASAIDPKSLVNWRLQTRRDAVVGIHADRALLRWRVEGDWDDLEQVEQVVVLFLPALARVARAHGLVQRQA